MSNPFTAYLETHADEVNAYLAAAYDDRTDDADIERYLYAPMARFSGNAGKRHRPLICMLAAAAVGGEARHALSCAAAIEHFQTAALIHDDIADNGVLRRGKPCLHRTEGAGLAINGGDLALTLMTAVVANDPQLSDAEKTRVLQELTTMCVRTIEGQALDLGWVRDGRFDITVEDYLTMSSHKTAYYSGAVPLACGAFLGGGSEEQIEALRAFGMASGLAFQIQDDLLNLVGEQEAKEKDFRSDITEGKRTLVAVRALQDPACHDDLVSILSSNVTDPAVLARAVEIFDATGALAFARSYALDLTAQAKRSIDGVELVPECRDLLLAMADFFVERLH